MQRHRQGSPTWIPCLPLGRPLKGGRMPTVLYDPAPAGYSIRRYNAYTNSGTIVQRTYNDAWVLHERNDWRFACMDRGHARRRLRLTTATHTTTHRLQPRQQQLTTGMGVGNCDLAAVARFTQMCGRSSTRMAWRASTWTQLLPDGGRSHRIRLAYDVAHDRAIRFQRDVQQHVDLDERHERRCRHVTFGNPSFSSPNVAGNR